MSVRSNKYNLSIFCKEDFAHITFLLLYRYSQPLDVVLGLLSDELHSLQDVGDVIDASLLDLQDLSGPVQVQNSIR